MSSNSSISGSGSVSITFTARLTAYESNTFDIGAVQGGLLGGIATSTILNATAANSSIGALDTAINTVNAGRAEMGATINVLVYAIENLANVSVNASASRSRVEDTDYCPSSDCNARAS